MKIKWILLAFLGITLFTLSSCNKEEEYHADKPQPVRFTSSVAGEEVSSTRAIGSSWSVNDAIGIYMKKTGSELNAVNILNDASNIQYITPAGNQNFSPANGTPGIFFPNSENVDFIAYYPYQTQIDDYIYKVDISNQESLEKIDLLYSSNAVNQGKTSDRINMSFSHQLAKLQFNVTTNNMVSTLNGLIVTISGADTKADFNLTTGQLAVNSDSKQTFTAHTTVTGSTAKSEAIILPTDGGTPIKVTFTLPGGSTFEHTFAEDKKFEKGQNYKYDIVLKNSGGDIEENWGYFETPLKTSIENTVFVLHHLPSRKGRNYSMLYDTKYRMAYWVAYPLHSYYMGSQSRTDAWQYDPSLLTSVQPYLKNSFSAANTDRGHQIPSADRNYNRAENETTFYYSNMTAQHSRMNQTVWANLEGQVRSWTNLCDTMYVVTGAVITTKTDKQIDYVVDNNSQQVARPKYYYKALVQKRGTNYYALGFKIDNSYPSSSNYNDYRVTVKQLEEDTGFTFFMGLGDDVKATIDTTKW